MSTHRPTAADLAGLPLFGGIPDDALASFADQAEVVSLEAGAILFRESEPARTLYVLHSGSLELVKRRDSDEVHLAHVQPGESFGEMSFIDMQPRSATVRATQPSILWMWPYAAFHQRYSKDSKCYTLLIMNMARELSRRLRRTDELLVNQRREG